MSFAWNHYLALADDWASHAADSLYPEAVYRSSISRAYYAIFHAAFDLAQTLGLQATRSAGDHFRLRKFFEGRGRVATQLSLALRALYNFRADADYEINAIGPLTGNAQAVAQEALDLAHKAMTMIEHLQSKAK